MFVVVLEDRHVDPVLSLHLTRAGADARIEEHKASYEERRYTWTVEDFGPDADPERWPLYLSTGDDGPTLRIERHEVEP